jgi:hypothetical protein
MLFAIHGNQVYGYTGGQKEIVHLVSTVDDAVRTGRPWAFTERHAELQYAEFFCDKADLLKVKWQVMPLRYWANDDETKCARQAEFLVHDFFPWSAFVGIGVYDSAALNQVESVLEHASHHPQVRRLPSWYY